MKQAQMNGYSNYRINEDGKIIDVTTNKKVPVAKGVVKLTSDGGEEIKFNVSDIMTAVKDSFVETAETTAPQTEGSETETTDTPEQAEFKAKKKELQAAVTEAKNKLINDANTTEEMILAKADLTAAQEALAAFIEENKNKISPEQEAAEAKYQEALSEMEDAKQALIAAKENVEAAATELRKYRKVAKTGKTGVDSVASRAPHLTYEDAQNIRKDYNEGMSVAKIAEKYGCSPSAVGYKINYLQHKLKKGDTAYTSLVNDYYPEGAPYFEDGVKETAEKYKLPANRKAPAVVTA